MARNPVPTVPGGGTIAFVDPVGQRYLDDPVAWEEGGTPAIVESIRAGLVVALRQAVGTDLIQERERRHLHRALARWRANPNLELLGNLEVPRLPIVSFRSATAAATCTTSWWWPCSTTCSGSRPGATLAALPPEPERLRDFHLPPLPTPAG